MSLLADIVAAKRAEADRLLRSAPPPARTDLRVRDVVAALARPQGAPLRLIAEIKFRSPSAGALSRAMDAAERAVAYVEAGAAMVSVLTDAHFFDGSFEHLAATRAAVDCPLLCKDFVVHPVQVDRAAAAGADAVLLIVRCVEPRTLKTLAAAARDRGLEPFVEIVDERELDAALEAGARVIGVNARDLDTLRIDQERAARVLESVPEGIVAAHLSGLRAAEDAARVALSRADAALVGETLMRCDDPRERLRELVAACAAAPAHL